MLDILPSGLRFRGRSNAARTPTSQDDAPASAGQPADAFLYDGKRAAITTQGIFKSPWALPALGSVCLPHIPDALSNVTLAYATRQLLDGELPLPSLAMLVGLQLVKLGAQPLSRWVTARWSDDAARAYTEAQSDALYNQPRLWLQQKPKETQAAMSFANDTPWAVQESVSHTAAGVGLLSGIALHGTMVAVTFDASVAVNFIVALGAAGAAGKLVAYLQKGLDPKPRNQSGQSADGYFKTQRGNFWDNIALGNQDNALRWAGQYDLAFQDWSTTKVRRDGLRGLVALGASVACGSLAFYNLSQSAERFADAGHRTDFAAKVLPMAWQACRTLGEAASVMSWLPGYACHQTIFARVLRDTLPSVTLDLPAHIGRGDKGITLTRGDAPPVSVTSAALEDMRAMAQSPGLIKISGRNGSGKSMLLTWLKEQFGTEAWMVPAKHDLMFGVAVNSSGGLGIDILQTLEAQVRKSAKAPVLLLDEVDANLDVANLARSRAIIQRLARTCCVFQVSHRDHEQALEGDAS